MSDSDDIGGLSYERALEELDRLIARLEAGRVDLDEAVGCYERGTRLAQHCERLLDRTEQKVTQVVAGAGGDREQPVVSGPPSGDGKTAGDLGEEPPAPVRARSVAQPFSVTAGQTQRRSGPPPSDPDTIPF